MKHITILVILTCILTGCMSTGFGDTATITTIGEMNVPDGKLELTVSQGNGSQITAQLYASSNMGAAKVLLLPEDINKLRDMLDAALNQPPSASIRDISTTPIGIIESYERSGLALSITQHNDERIFKMLAVGIYGIPRLHFNLSRNELKELNRLLGKAITEMDQDLPITAPQKQPK